MFGINNAYPYQGQGLSPGQMAGNAENLVKQGIKSVFANDQVANGILKIAGKNPIAQNGLMQGALGSSIDGAGEILTGVAKGGIFGGVGEGLVSLVENGIKVVKHEETASDGAGSVAADTTAGAASGLASAAASGGVMAALAGFAGMAGLPLYLLGGAVGLGVFYLADKFFKASPLYQQVKATVSGWIQNTLHI